MRFRNSIALLTMIFVVTATSGLLAAESQPGGDGRPYLQGKDEQKPLPEDTAKIKDKEWLKIGYPAFPGGFKPRLAVTFSEPQERQENLPPIQDEYLRTLASLFNEGREQPDASPLSHVEDIVRQALGRTNRFTMLERTSAQSNVLDEQQMGQSGMVDSKTAPAVGHLKGADFVVKATIIEINPEKESKDITGIAGGIGGGTLCVFQLKSATDSDANRPPIPIQFGHPFRPKPATDSDAIRPPLAG
ncbi:MAG: hypothetical protein IPG61_16075 [bacterium]|nr:hypothetical protein [bacterium]